MPFHYIDHFQFKIFSRKTSFLFILNLNSEEAYTNNLLSYCCKNWHFWQLLWKWNWKNVTNARWRWFVIYCSMTCGGDRFLNICLTCVLALLRVRKAGHTKKKPIPWNQFHKIGNYGFVAKMPFFKIGCHTKLYLRNYCFMWICVCLPIPETALCDETFFVCYETDLTAPVSSVSVKL
jgi:hypothetical protein